MTAAPPPSTLTRVEAYELAEPIVPARGDARGEYGTRRTLVVRVVADDGHEGWGQGGWPTVPVLEQVRQLARRALAPAEASGSAEVAYDVLAAFDLAMWDLAGRRAGKSLAALLGGARRSEVAAYASIHNYAEGRDPMAELDAAIAEARAAGYRGLKLKIGRGPVERERTWVERARRAAPDLALMADANQCYGREDALRMGEVLADLGCVWFEEPLPRTDVEGYRWLAERIGVPLAGGEDCEGADAVEGWAREGAVAIVQANLARIGGLSRLAETSARALAHAPHFAVHCWNAPLLHAATLQSLALVPEGEAPARWYAALETTTLPEPGPLLRERLSPGPDGTLRIPTGPGVGVEVDEAYVRGRAASTLLETA